MKPEDHKASGVQVIIETVKVEGAPSNGSGDEGFWQSTPLKATRGQIVNVVPGDGGGGERGAAHVDENGNWFASVRTPNTIDAGAAAFFMYHMVCVV